MIVCVYALAARGARPGRGFTAVGDGRVIAIVRVRRGPPRATPAALRAYHREMRALAARIPALLPVRFGTCFGDVAELGLVLRARQQTFAGALRRVRGRAQMTLRFAGVQPPSSSVDGVGSGREYLRARAAAQAVPELDPLRGAVRRWVREERVERKGSVATVYQLIPRGSADAYRSALARAAAAHGTRVLVSGPFPPYAFATSF